MSEANNQIPDSSTLLANVKEQFDILMGNMFKFNDEDMAGYDSCYADVFKNGLNVSYMAATFYAQFAAEILMGALSSNPFRKFLVQSINEEKAVTEFPGYWEPNMDSMRFGLPGKDYSAETADLESMMNMSYTKIMALNNWYGTDAGKEEFDMYCLSGRAMRDIKTAICQLPYLFRKYDHDEQFAQEIMEYAGIVAKQIEAIAGE